MRSNTFLWCVISIILSCMLTLSLTINLMEPPTQEFAPKSTDNKQTEEKYEYIIKDYGGRVAVYTKDNAAPSMLLEVYTQQLPIADREILLDGIKVLDYPALLIRLEDYIS